MSRHKPAEHRFLTQADGSQAMVTAVPQVLVVSSPGAHGMQYAVPQMMSPSNMLPMPQQMAMQFVGQGSGQDMSGYIGGPHSLGIASKVAGKSSNTQWSFHQLWRKEGVELHQQNVHQQRNAFALCWFWRPTRVRTLKRKLSSSWRQLSTSSRT